MNKQSSVSYNEQVNTNVYNENNKTIKTIILDFIYLLKGFVLIANAFPVLVGFWLALSFTNTSLFDELGLFLNTMIGSVLVISGALILNNWYEVDLDQAMERTKKRPTVTGSFSLKTVLLMGIFFTLIGFVFLYQTTMEAFIYSLIGWFMCLPDLPWDLHWLLSHSCDRLVLSGSYFCLEGGGNTISAFIKSADRGAIVRRGGDYAASCIGFVLVLLPLAIPYYQTQREAWNSALGGNRSDATALAVISPSAGIISLGEATSLWRYSSLTF